MSDVADSLRPRQIAICRTWDDLRNAIVALCAARHVSRRELDQRAGLAEGHCAKILGPKGKRGFGPVSLPWMLAALDLELVLQLRADAAPIAEQQNHAAENASERTPARQDWRRNRGSAWGRRMAARRALRMTREQRSASARKAAQARWQRRIGGSSSR